MQRFFVFSLLFLSVLLVSAYQLLVNPSFLQPQETATDAGVLPQVGAAVTTSPSSTSSNAVWTFDAPFDVPRHVLQNYYDALEQGQYKFAYSLWDQNGAASGFDFDTFQQRFQNLKSTNLIFLSQGEMGEAEGFRYFKQPATVETESRNGEKKSFQAEFTLRQPADSKVSETWRIYNLSYQQAR